ncbi:MAG TPA: alcohol dehydrogenase catalytic domain-containing protein [Planctomycetota bacterium]|nr:alcohol dehydrogenase catalytic domain-containing protein [Planctomycetota bacterium]
MTTARIAASAIAPRFVGGGRIDFAERAVPTPGPGELLVRVRANALCGSERHQWQHGAEVVPGHELVGEVVARGAGTTCAIGTTGAAYLMEFCGDCRSCRRGLTNQCRAKTADIGFTRDGGYGAFAVVAERAFFALPADVDAVSATMLLDVMGTGGHAIARAGLVQPERRSLLVLGGGPIGLGVLAMARLLLPGARVRVAEVNRYRLGLIERLGGIALDRGRGSLADAFAGADAPDVVVDTTGKASARHEAMAVLDRCGVLVCVGHGEDLRLEVSRDLISSERAVLGSEYFPFADLAPNLALLRDNRAYLAQIVTHRMPAAELAAAFTTFFAGDCGKVVVER